MIEVIERFKLKDFIHIALENNINFAEITYRCGAHAFIDIKDDFSGKKFKRQYSFKDYYFEEQKYWDYRYYVLTIMGKSYVMYEIEEEKVNIWVCYTNESARNKGYITRILEKLVELFPNKPIIGDTFNENLISTLKSLGIRIFRQQ